jgi:tRNA 2-thiouridine synthesizing protein A
MSPNEAVATDEQQQTDSLLAGLRSLQGSRCAGCAAPLCSHETLMSLVVGCQDQPRCLDCLALQMGGGREQLRDHLLSYIRTRACRRAGWEWANRQENFPATALPGCLWPAAEAPSLPEETQTMSEQTNLPPADAEWDAGNLGCGELVMGLRQRLMAMAAGAVLKLTATDAGMPEDLPAWCGLTGHKLIFSKHPEYWIQRREN